MGRRNSADMSAADVAAHNKRIAEQLNKVRPLRGHLTNEAPDSAPLVPKASKYRNVKVKDADGFTYDSRKEGRRFEELTMLQEGGVIRELRRQVTLGCYSPAPGRQPAVHVCDYVADFVYFEADLTSIRLSAPLPGVPWHRVIEDVKSEATRKNRVYRLKAKLVEAYYALKIREI